MFVLLQAPPAPTGTAQTPDDRGQAFRAVDGGGQMQSGERLLVIAYMAIWLCVVIFVIFSSRKQSRIEARIGALEGALSKTRAADKTSKKEGS
ncbi:MAG: CcmD family protein [Polyangiaceae bacterium]